jgi:hypothetical protein
MDKLVAGETLTALSGLAMAALMQQHTDCAIEDRPKVIAANAVRYARALLAELAKSVEVKTATP